ncbi:MAG: cytochrome c oxidase subunit 3 [Flavobacteriaceae bacterium]|nr:cytochrome c oxidase subunit 3 [Flavobacteriaceae bacterium]
MEANIAEDKGKDAWGGGTAKPMGASYGKMMMWFFIVSDALTFSGFLAAYGMMRFKFIDSWPIADQVFTHFPFIHGHYPMYYVALMTFILIFSSVTMVLAVDAGKQMKQSKVTFYLFLTIIGGIIFLGSQAWEWKNFINGSYGAIQLNSGEIVHFVDKDGHQVALKDFVVADHERELHTDSKGIWFEGESDVPTYTTSEVLAGFESHHDIDLRIQKINPETKEKIIVSREEAMLILAKSKAVIEGANLRVNEYGNTLFANFFFFITGFHGFHVLSGVILNIMIFINTILGTYQRRGHYEMVEKVGLYWHFVDLVWVFVFTFFYLV